MHSEAMLPGVYPVLRAIPTIGAVRGDFLSFDPEAEVPMVLIRPLDPDDAVRAARSAAVAVRIPGALPSACRECRAGRDGPHLRLVE